MTQNDTIITYTDHGLRVAGHPVYYITFTKKLLLKFAVFSGYWLFHCHIEFHVEVGMGIVFKVGEHSEMPPVPKNFPQCTNYLHDTHSTLPCSDSFVISTLNKLLPSLFESECGKNYSTTNKYSIMVLIISLLLTALHR